MWTSFVIAVNLFMCSIVAVPTQNDITKNFQAAVHHQNLQSILMSIEERLRNLDTIYAMHLTPTLEEKFEQYQRKLESIDTKIIRLESLVMLNLDKISENISTKNFKDDIARTNLVKKIDAIYEGISHRLGYLDRKFETNTMKIQGKVETTLTRLEKMDESFTRRHEDIEMELSDAIVAIDDLKTTCTLIQDNIINNTNEYFEVSLKEQMTLMENFNDKTNTIIKAFNGNTTEDLNNIEIKVDRGLDAINETDEFLTNLGIELKRELNEYAVKVAEMNSENWKTGETLEAKQTQLENLINSTKVEIQNGIRALMVLIGKIGGKDYPQDQSRIDKLNEKIDSNFEKVFSAQSLFMDSCYRLQMDESQIESKISEILEKLIETFEKKTAVEIKDIKNLEKLMKSHDAQIKRNFYQTSANIGTIYEKFSKDHAKFNDDLKQIADHLNALFTLVQDTLTDDNVSSKNILQDLSEMEKKIISLNKQGDILTNSVDEIKRIVEILSHKNSSQVISEYFKNISTIIAGMEAKINAAYLYYYFNRSRIDAVNQNLTRELQEVLKTMSNERQNSTTIEDSSIKNKTVEAMIVQIFGRKVETNETEENNQTITTDDSGQNLLNLIDVRANFDDYESNTTTIESLRDDETTEYIGDDQTVLKLNESVEYEDSEPNY